MKFKEFLNETKELKTNDHRISNSKAKHKYFPKNRKELDNIIESLRSKRGNNCDLNDIDVSNVKDMSNLFRYSQFNGDISKWDVSNVTNMTGMFYESEFNGDISKWDVSNVTDMSDMFRSSKFKGDISKWKMPNVKNISNMF